MPVTPADTPWLRRFHTADDGALRLFCFPHAGGNASYFFPLSTLLAPRTEMLTVQYPGRQERFNEPRIESMTELADIIAAELTGWTRVPFALFGHSMGATLAFEVACRLRANGAEPSALFVSGRRAPSIPAPGSVHLATDEELVADIRLLGGTESRMLDNAELLAAILPAVRSDYVATETYRYQGADPLRCPVTAFIGDADPRVDTVQAEAWARHTTGRFQLHTFSGGHFFLARHFDALAESIGATVGPGDQELLTRN
ncbi:thioesterase [Streptomyces nitrosporeus]|uniref:Thioesterase n=1 Tax=Streptomyces nitrosporeus TaxID=28894 RepID=A0A5J6FD86_9ACTN|nr:alpha/beta fold hydrolase [Streptomyces nitrosporeus]QEU73767.1 thioesterase [Streptomyces nitrosporeus]GGZ23632.1 thioesterase [Streptomyces nitrosporeus]